jgi:hypothetical protein
MAAVKEHRGCCRRSINAELTLCRSLAVFSARSGRCFTDAMIAEVGMATSCGASARLRNLSLCLELMFSPSQPFLIMTRVVDLLCDGHTPGGDLRRIPERRAQICWDFHNRRRRPILPTAIGARAVWGVLEPL